VTAGAPTRDSAIVTLRDPASDKPRRLSADDAFALALRLASVTVLVAV